MTGTDALESLDTEQRGAVDDLDRRSTLELVELMAEEDALVPAAVARAAPLAQVVDDVVDRLSRGGRLIYVGAGSSGRLAAVDAYECETTFSMPPGSVVAIVAGGGGSGAEQEAAEDDDAAGELDLMRWRRRTRRRRRDQRERPHPYVSVRCAPRAPGAPPWPSRRSTAPRSASSPSARSPSSSARR